MPRLSVQRLFDDRRERLGLQWAAGASGAAREFTGEMLAKPGVGLIGHLNLIHPLLAQVMGRREVEYVLSLDSPSQEQTASRIFGPDTICVFVCEGLTVPPVLREQLAPSGRLVLPVGPLTEQELELHVRDESDPSGFRVRSLGAVRFVPLV